MKIDETWQGLALLVGLELAIGVPWLIWLCR